MVTGEKERKLSHLIEFFNPSLSASISIIHNLHYIKGSYYNATLKAQRQLAGEILGNNGILKIEDMIVVFLVCIILHYNEEDEGER